MSILKKHLASIKFQKDIPEHKIVSGQKLIDILAVTKIVATKNEARRLIKEKAVTHEGQVIKTRIGLSFQGF